MPLNGDGWRTDLRAACEAFAPLLKQDITLDVRYGIAAGAILWSAREAPFNEAHKARLNAASAAKQPDRLPLLLRAVGGWDALDPLTAARTLSKRVKDNAELCAALDALMLHCLEELVECKILKQDTAAPSISIAGDVSGANIVIGGYQYVAGDLIIQYITIEKIRACPTAPKPPAHFAGRQVELDSLKSLLRQKQNTALTGIQGMGGIGKTALAQKLASELTEFSAVLWAAIGQTPSPVNTLINWAQHADPDFKPDEEESKDSERLAQRVRALLTNLISDECPGTVLIVFDDVWEGDGVRAARLLQKAAPVNSVTLITTRSQQVVAQLRSTRVELGYMTPPDALQMLRNLLQAHPEISDDTLLLLAKTVGYHPLAMELAAGQVGLLERPTQDINDLIKRYQGGIPNGSPFRDIKLELGEDREDNLELVLSFSYASLDEAEQSRFRALGVLAYDAPFSRDICKEIWQLEPLESLDTLRHRAMLTIAEEQAWYRQHPLLRAYARALLNEAGEMEVTFAHYADLVIVITRAFYAWQPEEWGQLDPYLPHIHATGNELVGRAAALTLAPSLKSEGSPEVEAALRRAQLFAINTGRYLHLRREVRQIDWSEMGLTVSRRLHDQRGEAYFLNDLGGVYSNLGEQQRALDYYEQALPLDRATGDRGGEATTLNNIGLVYSALGEQQRALDYYEQALPAFRDLGDRGGEATTLNGIGGVYSDLGEQQRALDYYEQALPAFRDLRDRGGEATTLNNIGRVYSDLGEQQRALDYYEQALPAFRDLGDRGGEATTLKGIGGVYSNLGEQQRALDYYEQALPLYRAISDRGGEAATLNGIGGVYSDLGEQQRALDYYEQALPLYRAISDRGGEATTLNGIGGVYSALGEKRRALDYYEQALPLYRAISDRGGEAATLNNIGRVYSALGEKRRALDYYEQALSLRRAVGDRRGEATTLNNIGGVYSDLGEQQQALGYYEQALSLRRAVGDRRGEAITLDNIGGVYFALGGIQQALDYYEQALPLRRAVGDRRGEATTLNNIGRVYSDLWEKQRALDYYEQALPTFRSVGDRVGEATTLNNIGGVYFALGGIQQALDYYEQALPILHAVEDRRREAVTCFNIGMIYRSWGDLDRAIEYVARCVELEKQIKHPTLASDRAMLERLKRERDGGTAATEDEPNTDAQAFIRQIVELYQQGGAEAVRAMLQTAGADAATIDGLLAQLAQLSGSTSESDS